MLSHFPLRRGRRIRQNHGIRTLIEETVLNKSDLIAPIFVRDGKNTIEAIPSMPGINRYSIDKLTIYVERLLKLGIVAVALFPYTPDEKKSSSCEEAWNPDNLVNKATRFLKKQFPGLVIMLDVALDPYNSDGHDGLLSEGQILNDETLVALEKQALIQSESGADILGPSDMMDGRVVTIRKALEREGFKDTVIMSYAAKFASAFYGPFREAVGAQGLLKGNKKTYQINPSNIEESLREVREDIFEGADMVMVKPGMPYLDVISEVKRRLNFPTFAYQVSGEYAMLKGAIEKKWLKNNETIIESLICLKRAGCDGILTYFALEAAEILENSSRNNF
ncbi:porphobilinogen synthase [Paracoccaceae bacterium]|nr:porphobilinogen synthase [Paracoccaceae bacterium]